MFDRESPRSIPLPLFVRTLVSYRFYYTARYFERRDIARSDIDKPTAPGSLLSRWIYL